MRRRQHESPRLATRPPIRRCGHARPDDIDFRGSVTVGAIRAIDEERRRGSKWPATFGSGDGAFLVTQHRPPDIDPSSCV